MISNKQFLSTALVIMFMGFILNSLFYINVEATADVIFQGSYPDGVKDLRTNSNMDIKKLQKTIAQKKQEILIFQKQKNPMGSPGDTEKSEVKPESPHIIQAIWFDPIAGSTAVVDGYMVKVNDYIPSSASKVISISKDKVTIKNSGKTFVLKL